MSTRPAPPPPSTTPRATAWTPAWWRRSPRISPPWPDRRGGIWWSATPPHFPSDPTYASADGLETALVGGVDGRALYDVLLARLDDLLRPGGTLLLAHSSLTDVARTEAKLAAAGYAVRTLQVCELDIPLRRYAAARDVLLARLYQLRAAGSAAFTGLRFEVHTLAATRPGEGQE